MMFVWALFSNPWTLFLDCPEHDVLTNVDGSHQLMVWWVLLGTSLMGQLDSAIWLWAREQKNTQLSVIQVLSLGKDICFPDFYCNMYLKSSHWSGTVTTIYNSQPGVSHFVFFENPSAHQNCDLILNIVVSLPIPGYLFLSLLKLDTCSGFMPIEFPLNGRIHSHLVWICFYPMYPLFFLVTFSIFGQSHLLTGMIYIYI